MWCAVLPDRSGGRSVCCTLPGSPGCRRAARPHNCSHTMAFDMALDVVGTGSVLSSIKGLLDDWTVDKEWYVEATADHAVYVERGTYKMPAQPYMRPAAQSVGQNVNAYTTGVRTADAAVESVAREVESEAKRIVPVDTGELRNSIQATTK